MVVKHTIEELWNNLSFDERLTFIRTHFSSGDQAINVIIVGVKDPWIWFEMINSVNEISPACITIQDFEEWLQNGC